MAALTITRTAGTDDDGSGTTGTVINAAWKAELYDQIDAVIAGILTNTTTLKSTIVTSSLTTIGTLSHSLGVGATPSAWSSGKAVEAGFAGNAFWGFAQDETYVTTNGYYQSGWKFGGTGYTSHYRQAAGVHYWLSSSASGTAGNAATMNTLMSLSAAGDLAINATKKFYLDGGNNTYLVESSADVISFVRNATTALLLDGTGMQFPAPPTTANAANAWVDSGTNYLYRSTSSRRYKQNIEPLTLADARAVVLGLRSVTYEGLNKTDAGRRWAGFIAEDVANLNPTLATFDPDGSPNYVTYDRVPAYLVPVVQDHDRTLYGSDDTPGLLARIAALEGRMN